MRLNYHRAQEQEVELEPNALSLLTKIGQETSLRYASHLITASNMIASKRSSKKSVNQDDVSRSYRLFIDTKRSVEVSLKNSQPAHWMCADSIPVPVKIRIAVYWRAR